MHFLKKCDIIDIYNKKIEKNPMKNDNNEITDIMIDGKDIDVVLTELAEKRANLIKDLNKKVAANIGKSDHNFSKIPELEVEKNADLVQLFGLKTNNIDDVKEVYEKENQILKEKIEQLQQGSKVVIDSKKSGIFDYIKQFIQAIGEFLGFASKDTKLLQDANINKEKINIKAVSNAMQEKASNLEKNDSVISLK